LTAGRRIPALVGRFGCQPQLWSRAMSESNLLIEKRKELDAKSKKFDEVMTAALDESGKNDFTRKDFLDKLGARDAVDAKEKSDILYGEVMALCHDVDELHIAEQKANNARVRADLARPIRERQPNTTQQDYDRARTMGQMAIESKDFRARIDAKHYPAKVDLDIDLKTVLQTSAGLQPRTGIGDVIVEKATRPVQVLDFIPTETTELFEYPFMQETTRTQAAAEVAETGSYAEDAFAYTRVVAPVQKIGSQIPCTDEQLADVGAMRSLMDSRLRFGLLAQLDKQILVGSGTPPALKGVLNFASIQTQAKGADPTANAIFKAMMKCRVTGRAVPDVTMIHGLDWQNIRLAQNANGDYQFGLPSQAGDDSLWGLPVLQTEALTQGTALTGAFKQYSLLLYRKGVEIQTGFINTQFILGELTIRADLRAAFAVYRDAAFCTITGI
jgi:HK97 family phage major capsid protein